MCLFKLRRTPAAPAFSMVPAGAAEQASAEGQQDDTWGSGAITPAQALQRYAQLMTPFEQREVLGMEEVRFALRPCMRKGYALRRG